MSTVSQSLINLIHDSIGDTRMYDRYNLLLRMLETQNPSNLSVELESSPQFIEQCKRCVKAMGQESMPILQQQYLTSTNPVTLTALGQGLLTDYLQPILTPKPQVIPASPPPLPLQEKRTGSIRHLDPFRSQALAAASAAASSQSFFPSSQTNENTKTVTELFNLVDRTVREDSSLEFLCGGGWLLICKLHARDEGSLVAQKNYNTSDNRAPIPLCTVRFNKQNQSLSFWTAFTETRSQITDEETKNAIMDNLLASQD